MADEGEPMPVEEYDHTIPKPKRSGLAILASLLFLGGGQLVKGHFRRFLAMWGIVAVTVVAVPLAASQLRGPCPEQHMANRKEQLSRRRHRAFGSGLPPAYRGCPGDLWKSVFAEALLRNCAAAMMCRPTRGMD